MTISNHSIGNVTHFQKKASGNFNRINSSPKPLLDQKKNTAVCLESDYEDQSKSKTQGVLEMSRSKSRYSKDRNNSRSYTTPVPIGDLVQIAQKSAELQMYRQLRKNEIKQSKIQRKQNLMKQEKTLLEKEVRKQREF